MASKRCDSNSKTIHFSLIQNMILSLLVCVVGVAMAHGSHGYLGHRCGNDHPAVAADFHHSQRRRAEQAYVTRERVRRARGLAESSQDYGDGLLSYTTAHEADDAGETDNIRLTLVWDVIEDGDSKASSNGNKAMCVSKGQTYDYRTGGGWQTADEPCRGDQVVTTTNARYNLIVQRTQWARDFWESGVRLKPVEDDIEVDSSILNDFALDQTTYSNTDMVIIMTARPQPDASIAGYAICLQTDQYDRCTVGQFNWVPSTLNVEDPNPMSVTDERHTAVHEITHLLGGIIPGTHFVDENGMARPASDLFFTGPALDDVEDSRDVTFIKTERVLTIARDAYACPDAQGVPLEDVPLGRGSHWEARVLGPELMSYGSGAGMPYVSDLTLAFLEDSNQYVANYSHAGRLTQGVDVDFESVNRGILTSQAVHFDKSELRKDWSPGYPTYGRKQGCGFLKSHPKGWPKQYTCSKHQQYMCTPDNRVSAVCVIQTGLEVDQEWSCAEPSRTDPSCSNSEQNDNCDGGTCRLPTELQFFSDKEARDAFSGFRLNSGVNPTAEDTAGYSHSLDYVPVPVGFWSCLDTDGSTNSTGRITEESGVSLGDLLDGTLDEMSVFGGQTRCKQCRCFESSLVAFSRIAFFNPTFPQYGLCYISNCAKKDVLQVGIRNQVDQQISWYRCPPEGGKIWIAGFSGSMHCPNSEEFCMHENVSGVLHPETNRLVELYIYGAVTAVVLLILCLCICPCSRDRVHEESMRFCGVKAYEEAERKERRGGEPVISLHGGEPEPPGRCESVTLIVVNTVTLAFGLFLTAYMAYYLFSGVFVSAIVPALMIGIFIMLVSCSGVRSANKPSIGPSCSIINYYYSVLLLFLLIIWFGVHTATGPSVENYVQNNYDLLAPALPDDAVDSTASREEQVDQATAYIETNMVAIGATGIVIAFIFLVALFAAGRVMGRRIIASTKYSVLSFLSIVSGIALIALGILYAVQTSIDFTSLGAWAIALGCILLLVGLGGVLSSRAHSVRGILIVSGISLLLSIGFIIGAGLLYNTAANVPSILDDKSEDEIAEMQQDFGVAMSRDAFEAFLIERLEQVATAFAVLCVAAFLLATSGILFRHWLQELIAQVHKALRQQPAPSAPSPTFA